MRGIDLKRLRMELGMTQKELAKVINVSRPLISQIEAGKKNITKTLEDKITQELNSADHVISVEAKIDFLRIRFKVHQIDPIV